MCCTQATERCTVRAYSFAAVLGLFGFGVVSPSVGAEEWSQWRGPRGDGHSGAKDLPIKWSKQNVLWRTRIPGRGQSSPVAWGNRIYLTSATDGGRKRVVLAVDGTTGKIVWERVAATVEAEQIHNMNTWATPTCATDGERVVAYFGHGGLYCYGVNGRLQWQQELGALATSGWGVGSSPIVLANKVIQVCDGDNQAFLIAIDLERGKTVWKTPRPKNRSFSTPLLVTTEKRRELVVNGHAGMRGYDPETGRELWSCSGGSGRGTPSVVSAEGMVIAVSGRSRGAGDMIAVRAGGSGDLTQNVVWKTRRGGRDIPSPIVVGHYVLSANLRPGVAACYDLRTGRLTWKQRLGVGGFTSSPIAANGLVYTVSESGTTVVFRPGDRFEQVARNKLRSDEDETFRASLMPYRGRIYCRSDKYLYCIGKQSLSGRG